MKTFLGKALAAGILAALFSGQTSGAVSPPSYKVTDLGTLSGTSSSEALALNDRGQVVGVSSTGVQERAFLWEKGALRPLPLLPGSSSLRPHAINDWGQIIGTAFGPDSDTRRAFLVDKGKVRDLGTPPGEYSEAAGINNQGQVVGKSYACTVNDKGQRQITLSYTFLWSEATGIRKLSPRTDDFGENVSAISSTGQVIGSSWTLGTAEERLKRAALPPDKQPIQSNLVPYAAFLWQSGLTRSLSPPQSWSSGAIAFNGRGDVLGGMSVYPEADEVLTSSVEEFNNIENTMRHSHHVFVWRNGQSRDLGELAEQWGAARAFNDADDIVGYTAREGQPEYHAFLWREGRRYILTDLISAAGWVLEKATGINNHGQIIGMGVHKGRRHAFLLTPR